MPSCLLVCVSCVLQHETANTADTKQKLEWQSPHDSLATISETANVIAITFSINDLDLDI